MIQHRHPNNYESIQIKLYITEEIERIFLGFLGLYDKALRLGEEDRSQLTSSLLGCINWMINDGRATRSKLYEETLERENVRGVLRDLGVDYGNH